MIDKPYRETFNLPLTREEVEERAAQMVRAMDTRDRTLAELDEEKKRAKAEVESLDGEIARLAGEVRTRSAYQTIDVIDRLDEDGFTVETVAVQTGEILRKRPAKPEERQLRMFKGEGEGAAG